MMIFCSIGLATAQDKLGLAVGVKAPDFTAQTHKGEAVTLSDIYTKGPVVLVFYRGGWCMYCNRQLQALQQKLGEFQAQQASVIAASVDLQDKAAKTVEENELGFTVISNPEAHLLEKYNLVYNVPDDLAKKYKEEYEIDLEASSGRSDHVIAVPATYVIDTSGTIVYAYVNRNYKVRPSLDDVLEAVKSIKQ